MIKVLQQAIYKHGYLFIIAAWLYTISFVFTNYWSYSSTPHRVQSSLEKYIATQEKNFEDLLQDNKKVQAIVYDTTSDIRQNLTDEKLGIFAYLINDLGNPIEIYWNTSQMAVNISDISRPDGNYPVHYQNGLFELLKRSVFVNGKEYVFTGLIPLHWSYFIDNKYLRKHFAGVDGLEKNYYITSEKDAIPVKNSNGETVYYIQKKFNSFSSAPDALSITLRVIAIVTFLLFISFLAQEIVLQVRFWKGVVFLVGFIIVLRALTYKFPFPFDFRSLELFDPAIYASSFLHPSLGDLLVNSILVFLVVIFIRFAKPDVWTNKINLSPKLVNIIAVASLFCFAFLTLELASIIRSFIYDSKISFDVSNFFGLSFYTFISFVIFSFLILAYYHLSFLMMYPAKSAGYGLYWSIVVVVSSGLLLLSFNIGEVSLGLKIAALMWLICYILLLNIRERKMTFGVFNSSSLLLWIIIFASSVSVVLIAQKRSFEIEKQKKIAEKLAMQTDPYGENLLNIATTGFSGFLDSNFNRFENEYYNKYIKDSLISINFSGYLNKYDTRIYTYDHNMQPLYNEDSTSYLVIKSIIDNLNNKTQVKDIPNLYYFENNPSGFSYLYNRDIRSNDSLLGYFVIIMKPKQYKNEALYPELFKQVNDLQSDLNINYAFAVYSNYHLINNFNEYPFADSISPKQLPVYEFEERQKGKFDELWYKTTDNKVIIVVRKNTWVYDLLTLFAFLFITLLIIVLLLNLLVTLVRSGFRRQKLKQLFDVNIRVQIQTTIVLISIFSFLVIGITTISFFIRRFDENNEDRLKKAIEMMTNEIEEAVKSQLVFDNQINLNDVGFNGDLEHKIIDISNIHNVDVNFYDVNGNLKVSTQPYLYKVLSDKMNPKAFEELHYKHQTQFIQKEFAGDFSYLSIYEPVKGDNHETIAYLNIPYFNSQNVLNQEISSLLVTLINLNALIFVLAGIIALLLTNRITASFELIGNKMKAIHFGEKNEEIVWNKNDEIGVLVNEYNKMVKKLEESAQALARTEREGAWQEMARQVAHEIKNPLTPMKLSIQYLQKAINNDSANVKELSKKVAATLIEQIDQLSKIASDFSQFSNIGNVYPEVFDLSEIIASLITLYDADSNINISWTKEEGIFQILSDKTQMTRLFTNLFKNAIEASPEDEKVIILIHQYIQDGNVVVAVTDNGSGIEPAMRSKIFVPNFTTKSSGTGLGLAICKGIVEKAGGKIWFDTKEDVGTTFYVSLPLFNKEVAELKMQEY